MFPNGEQYEVLVHIEVIHDLDDRLRQEVGEAMSHAFPPIEVGDRFTIQLPRR